MRIRFLAAFVGWVRTHASTLRAINPALRLWMWVETTMVRMVCVRTTMRTTTLDSLMR
jgi:hypothetical protein